MSTEPSTIGDIDLDDACDADDHLVDWSQVDLIARQIDGIQAIEDPAERLEAAKRWAAEMAA